MEKLVVIKSCHECPHEGGGVMLKAHCELTGKDFPEFKDFPNWCPLPNRPDCDDEYINWIRWIMNPNWNAST